MTTKAGLRRLEKRVARVTRQAIIHIGIVKVDKLGVDGIASPGQTVQGNVTDWLAEHAPASLETCQRVVGFDNV